MRGLFTKKHGGPNPGGGTASHIIVCADIYSVGTSLGEFLAQDGGLSNEEVLKRTSLLGPNIIPIDRPTVYGSVMKEFNKPFYLYLNFMVWTWFPYWYYYMGIVNSCARLVSGLVVALFQHNSDSVLLYRLALVEGEVE
jgi:hypothetical protein